MATAYLIDRNNDLIVGPFTGTVSRPSAPPRPSDAMSRALDYAERHNIDSAAYASEAINWALNVRRVLPSWHARHILGERY